MCRVPKGPSRIWVRVCFRSPPTADPELSGTGPQLPQELLACGVGQSWTPDALRASTGLPEPRMLMTVLSP